MNQKEKLIEIINNVIRCDKCGIVPEWIAEDLIFYGVTVQEWVSVDDRLPTWRDGKVLVFTKYGFSICERTVNNRWRGLHANCITHWAYLPNPPKGE